MADVLKGRAGAYYVPADDQAGIRPFGLSLVLGSDFGGLPAPDARASSTSGLRYIDTTVWEIISKYVPQSCHSVTTPCTLPARTRQSLLDAVKRRIAEVRGNPAIIGFYILDDYPGNIADVLNQVHALVATDNHGEAAPRPTVCAFGATLDTWEKPGGPLTPHHDFQLRGQDFVQGIVNFSPSACDAVSLYPYAPPGAQSSMVDWSMSQLLPFMLGQLSQRGWSPTLQPLIGTPQAFGYPAMNWQAPTGADVQAQTDAFCKAGARSVIAYAWDDGYTNPRVELFNSPDLRNGFAHGVLDCKRQWTSG